MKIVIPLFSWILYLLDFESTFRALFSASIFLWNVTLVYSLFQRDSYLKITGFYKYLNISEKLIGLSKASIFGLIMLIHISALLFVSFGNT